MNYYYFIFRSITQAQHAGILLRKGNIANRVFRTPAGLTERGCSYTVKIYEKDGMEAKKLLVLSQIPYFKVFLKNELGYTEVTL